MSESFCALGRLIKNFFGVGLVSITREHQREFFMAMYRQNKRARFLRYWASGHGIGGANATDMWKQIYAWFDEF